MKFPALASVVLAALVALDAQFSSRVNVVEVYVTVASRDGRPVQGLSKADFTLFEDDTPQAVSVFAAGQMGLSVAIALDRSFSMAGERLQRMKQATERFLRVLRPADQSMLIAIGSTVDVLAPLSSNRAAQLDALVPLDAWGSTSLHDAAIQALDQIQAAPGRRALVLLSDGADRYSRASAEDVIDRARRGDVLAYPIALGKTRPPLFVELAAVTGGRSLQVSDPNKLAESLSSIADELRQQYLLGYEPASAPEASGRPRWHRLRVEVNRKDVVLRARPGYWSR